MPPFEHREFFGRAFVTQLLDYVDQHRVGFEPAYVCGRRSHTLDVNDDARHCMRLGTIGPFESIVTQAIGQLLPQALTELGLLERQTTIRELEFCAFNDGGFFQPHIDTMRPGMQRVLSCVYYFFREPAGYSGGELRLHAWPSISSSASTAPPGIDIAPECDSLVIFPSALRHEVRPVACVTRR